MKSCTKILTDRRWFVCPVSFSIWMCFILLWHNCIVYLQTSIYSVTMITIIYKFDMRPRRCIKNRANIWSIPVFMVFSWWSNAIGFSLDHFIEKLTCKKAIQHLPRPWSRAIYSMYFGCSFFVRFSVNFVKYWIVRSRQFSQIYCCQCFCLKLVLVQIMPFFPYVGAANAPQIGSHVPVSERQFLLFPNHCPNSDSCRAMSDPPWLFSIWLGDFETIFSPFVFPSHKWKDWEK